MKCQRFSMNWTAAGLLAVLGLCGSPAALAATPVAHVDFAAGEVKAFAADGHSRPLAKGAAIASGETIDTGSGRAQLRFSDGAQIALSTQTQFRIDDYQFSGRNDGSEKGFFSLLKGGLRTITGLIGHGKRENYRLSTTVATIGIRGTEYSVTYGNGVDITTGEGTIEVCNAAGCLILASGESAFVPDAQTRPALSQKKAELPPPPAEPIPVNIAGDDTDQEGKPAALLEALSEPVIPIASNTVGAGAIGVMYTKTGVPGVSGGLLGGTHYFGPSAELVSFIDGTTSLNDLSLTTLAESNSDGFIGWGRWTSGTVGGGSLTSLTYVANLTANDVVIPSIVRGYAAFASTAPIVTSGGYFLESGSPNLVTGDLTVNFANVSGSGGTLSYTLNIPVNGSYAPDTFTVIGSAQQYANNQFLGTTSSISSSSTFCNSGCSGTVPYGDAIHGFFTGSNAERAGANYSFGNGSYNVSGAVVFK